MRKLILLISSLLLILVPAAVLYSKRAPAAEPTGAVKTFAVEARMWGWTPATIEVDEGDNVVLRAPPVDEVEVVEVSARSAGNQDPGPGHA